MCQKVPTFKLSVTLSNLNQFKKKIALLENHMKFVTKPYNSNDLILGMLMHSSFENRLRFDKVKASLKVGNFGDTVYTFLVLIHEQRHYCFQCWTDI